MAWSDAARAAAALARKLRANVGPLSKGSGDRALVNRMIAGNRVRLGSKAAYRGAMSNVADLRKTRTKTPRPSVSSQLRSMGRGHGLTPAEAAKRKRLRGY